MDFEVPDAYQELLRLCNIEFWSVIWNKFIVILRKLRATTNFECFQWILWTDFMKTSRVGFSGRFTSSSMLRRPGNCCEGDNRFFIRRMLIFSIKEYCFLAASFSSLFIRRSNFCWRVIVCFKALLRPKIVRFEGFLGRTMNLWFEQYQLLQVLAYCSQ